MSTDMSTGRRDAYDAAMSVRTIDYHTAGEPFRIVLSELPEISGATVAERRTFAQGSEEIDVVRRLLCNEPRGHADMYGGFITPGDDDGAHFGVLFWHKDGYSTACGHGTIALGVWAVQSGRVASDPDGVTTVVIDVPSGRVHARVRQEAGVVTAVTFRNVASYVIAVGLPVETTRGRVLADLSYSGAIYASVKAADLGLAVTSENYSDLVAIGREIKWALNDHALARHPEDDRLSGVYGTILFDDLGDLDGSDGTQSGPHQRNITIFADGEADRSPCGSGTGSRVALLTAAGRLGPHQTLTHDSIVGTRFLARAVEVVDAGGVGEAHAGAVGRTTIVPEVEGLAYTTGEHLFTLNASDDVGTGFVLR